MAHRREHLCSASQLWLPHPALHVVPPECFRGLHIWSGAVGSKSGKLQNVADRDRYEPCPCHLFCIGWVEDGVDFLCGPGACGSSLHVQQDEQDVAALIWELRLPHTEVEGTFGFEAV